MCLFTAPTHKDRLAARQPDYTLQVTVDRRGHVDCVTTVDWPYEYAKRVEERLWAA